MRNLEQVNARQPASNERWIDPLFDVPREQDSVAPYLSEQDDRDIVDGGPAVGRSLGHGARIRPQDPEGELVESQMVAGHEDPVRNPRRRQSRLEGSIPGPGPDHAWLEDPPDPEGGEERGEPRGMVFVWMGQHDDVDPAVPRRKPFPEGDQQAAGIRTPIDEHATPLPALDEDGVPLPHGALQPAGGVPVKTAN